MLLCLSPQLYFGVSVFSVNFLCLLFLLIYVPLAFLASAVMARWGLRRGLVVGAALNVAGAFFKLMPWPYEFGWESSSSSSSGEGGDVAEGGRGIGWSFVVAGTVLCATAQLFTLTAPVLIAQSWHGEHERVIATAIGTSANAFGCALAFALVPITLGTHDAAIGEDVSMARQVPLHRLLLTQFILAAVAAYAIVRWFEERPPTPPSFSAAAASGVAVGPQSPSASSLPTSPVPASRLSSSATSAADSSATYSSSALLLQLIEEVNELARIVPSLWANSAFRSVLVTFAVLAGATYAVMGTLLGALLSASAAALSTAGESTGGSSADRQTNGFTSLCGVVLVLSGLVATNAAGFVADHYPQLRVHHKRAVWVCLALACSALVLCAAIPNLSQRNDRFVLAVMILLGVALNAPAAVLLDLAAESAYPAPPTLAPQILLVAGALCGVLLILVLSVLQSLSVTLCALVCALLFALTARQWNGFEFDDRRRVLECTLQRRSEVHIGFTRETDALHSAGAVGPRGYGAA